MQRTLGPSVANLKISLLRFGLSFVCVLHILAVVRYTGWQHFSMPQLLLLLTLYFLVIGLGILSVLGWKSDKTSGTFAVSIFVFLVYVNIILDSPFKIHGLFFYSSALMILSLAAPSQILTLSDSSKEGEAGDSARALDLFRLYIYLVYIISVISKVRLGFLSGTALETHIIHLLFGSLPVAIQLSPDVYKGLSYLTVGVELLLPVVLFMTKTRYFGIILAIGFQLIASTLLEKTSFTTAIIISMVAFIDDQKLRRWLNVT
jgi:hypothetical protein